MADNEQGEETGPRDNEWEVVSLTASAYAAAPGPERLVPSQYSQTRLHKEHEGETSNAMFMSGHFVFPPSQHENLPIEPELDEMHGEKGYEDDLSHLGIEEGVNSDVKDEKNVTIEGLMTEEFPGYQVYDDKGNTLSVSGVQFRKDVAFDKLQSIYTRDFSLFASETTMDKSNNCGDGAGTDEDDAVDLDLPNFQEPLEGDKCDGTYDLPCEAWWKRRALSLYAQAKETNTLWSVFMAAAVMGLVIIGHQWQQERWQVLSLRWQLGINDERMGRLIAPISRLVGGHRRGSLLRTLR